MKKKYFKGNVFTCIWAADTQGLVSFMLWILGFFEDQNWLNKSCINAYICAHTYIWGNWEFVWLAYMSHAWLLHNGLSKSCSVQVAGYLSSLRCWIHWSSVHVGKQKGLSSRKPEDGSSCGSQRWIYSLSSKGEQGQMKGHSFSPEPPWSWAPTRECLPPWGRVFFSWSF